ncbi:FadR/GntR family transcriptional regulator, partial [Aeromonas jandaei]
PKCEVSPEKRGGWSKKADFGVNTSEFWSNENFKREQAGYDEGAINLFAPSQVLCLFPIGFQGKCVNNVLHCTPLVLHELEAMKNTPVSKALTEELAYLIVSEHYESDNQLPGENEIARQFNTSRTSVRSALQSLEAKRMLIIQPKKRSTVAPIENWNWLDSDVLRWTSQFKSNDRILCHLIATRLIFEPNIAALAALNATGKDLAKIEGGYELMRDGRAEMDRNKFNQGDILFHNAIIHASHNPFLLALGNMLTATMEMSFASTLEDDISLSDPALEEHWIVLEAIRMRDAEKARNYMREVVLASMRKVLPEDPAFISLIR